VRIVYGKVNDKMMVNIWNNINNTTISENPTMNSESESRDVPLSDDKEYDTSNHTGGLKNVQGNVVIGAKGSRVKEKYFGPLVTHMTMSVTEVVT
jgi:hypothetical protein